MALVVSMLGPCAEAQSAPAAPGGQNEQQVSTAPATTPRPLQANPFSYNLHSALDLALGGTLGIPSVDRYLEFRRERKPLALDIVVRNITTGPIIAGPIFESWGALSYSPVARDHHYMAPFYERGQAATSIWMLPARMLASFYGAPSNPGPIRPTP